MLLSSWLSIIPYVVLHTKGPPRKINESSRQQASCGGPDMDQRSAWTPALQGGRNCEAHADISRFFHFSRSQLILLVRLVL